MGLFDIFFKYKCPKCGKHNIEVLAEQEFDVDSYNPSEYAILRCENCGHYFVNGKSIPGCNCANANKDGYSRLGIYRAMRNGRYSYGLYCRMCFSCGSDARIKRDQQGYYYEYSYSVLNQRQVKRFRVTLLNQ